MRHGGHIVREALPIHLVIVGPWAIEPRWNGSPDSSRGRADGRRVVYPQIDMSGSSTVSIAERLTDTEVGSKCVRSSFPGRDGVTAMRLPSVPFRAARECARLATSPAWPLGCLHGSISSWNPSMMPSL